MHEPLKKNILLKTQNQSIAVDNTDRPFSYWGLAALLLSLIGTNTAVILWIFLDVPIFLSYVICFGGFSCAFVILLRRKRRIKRRGRVLAKAAMIICILWIPIFLMAHWCEQEQFRQGHIINFKIFGWKAFNPNNQPVLKGYDPNIVIGYGIGLPYSKDLLCIALPKGRALRLPVTHETKIRQVYFNNYSVRLVQEEKLRKLLAAQEADVEDLQDELGKIFPPGEKFFDPKWAVEQK